MLYKEFALSLSNRHHFHTPDKVDSFTNIASDTFMSLWDYDETVLDHVRTKKTLSGFAGNLHMPNEFIFDVDGANLKQAKDLTLGLLTLLDIPAQLYFSGSKGFHVHISGTAFKWQPCDNLHLKVKHVLKNVGIYDYADPLVIDKVRLIRVPNTLKIQSGYWKVPLTHDELLNIDQEWLDKNAIRPREGFNYRILDTNPIFDVTIPLPKAKLVSQSRSSGSNDYVCIQRMMENAPKGYRHMTALTIGSHLRKRYPEDSVRALLEHWRSKVHSTEHPFAPEEMEKLINSIYNANNGEGYNYGCDSVMKDKYCSSSCNLYKAKAQTKPLTINDMEQELINFYSSDINPVDIGQLYNTKFPIYPGEVMMIGAPPESMKSMLILNWALSLNRSAYFLELEMSSRQVAQRVAMIQNGWNEEEMISHYSSGKNGMPQMSHIHYEYSPCYVWEIKKKLQVLNFNPEIIFIDHCGLLKSRFNDEMQRDKDISGELMLLAKDLNCIIIGIWEMPKSAIKDGMDITGLSGSVRTAYNANKILFMNPMRNHEGTIQHIELVTIKNREQQRLNCRLDVDPKRNGRIT